jgi:hypothetical protein
MKKNTLYFNRQGYAEALRESKEALLVFGELYAEIQRLSLINVKTVQELTELAEGQEAYLKERIASDIKELPKIGNFFFKRSTLVESLDLPSFEKLNEICNKALQHNYAAKNYLSLSNGILAVITEDQLKEKFSIYAETSEESKLLELHQEAAKSLQAFHDYAQAKFDTTILHGRSLSLDRHFYFNEENGLLQAKDDLYRRLRR